ncbi:MAG: toll/interleukin-1 receptor domain-containing protein [Verrucomicrobia bacterium]|nr:toll/interleukin-1 receptor domain-containing protein [Verrucomicrobiota bacterium]
MRQGLPGTKPQTTTMSEATFPYDVFFSHSAKDKAVVRPLADRLRLDGLKVPFHFGIRNSEFGFAQPGMSAQAFGSDWAQLEAGTFRFRDPLNQERRFISPASTNQRSRIHPSKLENT